jgi:acyl-CoA synthetase (AMP-forming)/AMP-acid ligase II
MSLPVDASLHEPRRRHAEESIPFASLIDLLRHRASEQPQDRAYVFLSDRGNEEAKLTFSDLHQRAHAFAATMLDRAKPGDRALLLFPAGLDFVVAFLACIVARLIPVPMMLPRRASSRGASEAILADCAPKLAITTRGLATTRPDVIERFQSAGVEWMFLEPTSGSTSTDVSAPPAGPDDIALLQYTSGSTSDPKGVMVSHGNVLANSEMIRRAFGNTRESTFVSWVPYYHDMGLIVNIMQTLYLGALCVLIAPATFVHRPLTWLRAIHAYRAEVATGPNFAYDLCVSRFREDQMRGLDLSCWKLAANGAEPVRQDTIDRFAATFAPYGFRSNVMYPAYGLAEATLLVSGGRRGSGSINRQVSRSELQKGKIAAATIPADTQTLVGCGRSLVGERLAIVDPASLRRLGTDTVGEVWVHGANVTKGYWQNAAATEATFQARIADEGDERWLRTGDLGFLCDSGELFITGRIKDVIIIRGINHYPHDIENTVQRVHPALSRNCGAAFTADADGREKLVVVQEVERGYRHQIEAAELAASIREAVVEEHDVNVDEIVFIGPGALPKTTSGKVQRRLTRTLWVDGLLQDLA